MRNTFFITRVTLIFPKSFRHPVLSSFPEYIYPMNSQYDYSLLKQIRNISPFNGGGCGNVARYLWWTKCFAPIQYIETWAFLALTSFCELLYFVQVHLVQKQLHWRKMVLTRRNDCDHRFCPHLPFAYSSRLDGLKHGHESWPDSEKKDLGEKIVLCKRLNICTKANSNTKKNKFRLDITVNIMWIYLSTSFWAHESQMSKSQRKQLNLTKEAELAFFQQSTQ